MARSLGRRHLYLEQHNEEPVHFDFESALGMTYGSAAFEFPEPSLKPRVVYTKTEKLARLSYHLKSFLNRTSWSPQTESDTALRQPLISLPRHQWDRNQLVPYIALPLTVDSNETLAGTRKNGTCIDIIINNLDDGHIHSIFTDIPFGCCALIALKIAAGEALIHTLQHQPSKACIACRSRKLRCNVSTSGIPCASCQSSEIECAISHARKARYRASAKEFRNIPSGFHVFDANTNPPDEPMIFERGTEIQPRDNPQQGLSNQIYKFLDTAPQALDTELTTQFAEIISKTSALSRRDFLHEPSIPYIRYERDWINQKDSTQNPISEPQSWNLRPQRCRVMLPDYVDPLRDDLKQDDLSFLHYKGALSLPNNSLQDQLLGRYLVYVHPLMPLLDLDDFYQAIYDGGKSAKSPLILIQAVMFCAVPYVDLKLLQAEGFGDREQAREKYFEKVRVGGLMGVHDLISRVFADVYRLQLLFDFNVELDPMTLIRTLLLMTFWYENPEDMKGRWHWIRIAISSANGIGLDRSSELTKFTPKQQQAKKRLWWCCYLRDRMISFNERRPSSIPEADIPALNSEDFQTQSFQRLLQRYDIQFSTLQASLLNEIFIQFIQLCIIFGRVLKMLYTTRGHRRWTHVEPKIVFLSKTDDSVAGEVMTLDQELCRWSEQCCVTLRQQSADSEQGSNIAHVHHAALDLFYQSVRSMVHRPHVSHLCPEGSAARMIQTFSMQRLREAAQESTLTARRLRANDLLEHLPPFGITTLLSAGMQHVHDMCSRDDSIRVAAAQHFRLILSSLYGLKAVYRSARHAIGLLKIVHQRKMVEPFPTEEDVANDSPQPQLEHCEGNDRAITIADNDDRGKGIYRIDPDASTILGSSHTSIRVSEPTINEDYIKQPWEIGAAFEDILEWYGPPQTLDAALFEFYESL